MNNYEWIFIAIASKNSIFIRTVGNTLLWVLIHSDHLSQLHVDLISPSTVHLASYFLPIWKSLCLDPSDMCHMLWDSSVWACPADKNFRDCGCLLSITCNITPELVELSSSLTYNVLTISCFGISQLHFKRRASPIVSSDLTRQRQIIFLPAGRKLVHDGSIIS